MGIVFGIISVTVCFVYLALLFLDPTFVVRRHDNVLMILPCPIKYYVYQELGRIDINQYLANTGVLK